ncbi:hypothetical protein F3J34_49295 [Klebsiella sp. Ap-873]|nr:hypothetical protein [Klebsiella sp. Ap-873]
MSNNTEALIRRLKVYAEEFRSTVLSADDCIALIAALEQSQQKNEELLGEQAEHDKQIAAMESKFNLAVAGLASKAKRCETAEKRIAELEQELIKPLPIGELIHRLEVQTNEPWGEWWQRGMSRNDKPEASPLAVKLPAPLMPAQHASGELFMTPDNVEHGGYLNRDDVLRAIRAAGGTVDEGE